MKIINYIPLASTLILSLLIISCGGGSSAEADQNDQEIPASGNIPTETDIGILKPVETDQPPKGDVGIVELPNCEQGAPSSYLVNYYEVSNIRYDEPIGDKTAYQTPTSLGGLERVEWSRFGIELNAAHQTYYSRNDRGLSFSLFPQANACSPLPPVASQRLVSISVTSDNAFSEEYPAGAELASLLAPIKYLATEFPYDSIDTFAGKNLPAPRQLSLYLLQEPENNRQNFTITITLDDGNTFIVETGDIYFSSDEISF